jgi:hypothetical protein
MTPDLPSPKAPVSETPKTDALIARHKAETHALETRFPDRGYVVTRHEWRDHSVRQAQELLDHTKDLEREVSSLRAQLSKVRDGWIPVSERLPETSGWYQVWHDKMPSRLELQRIPTYYFDSSIKEWRNWHYSGTATHWMPLPVAPKEPTT